MCTCAKTAFTHPGINRCSWQALPPMCIGTQPLFPIQHPCRYTSPNSHCMCSGLAHAQMSNWEQWLYQLNTYWIQVLAPTLSLASALLPQLPAFIAETCCQTPVRKEQERGLLDCVRLQTYTAQLRTQ